MSLPSLPLTKSLTIRYFPLWKPLCVMSVPVLMLKQKGRNDAFHRYLIYMLILSPSGAFCRCCCYCCFLCGFISAVGWYFCRINTFKLPKLTFRFLMVKLTLSQDTCRRLRSTCKSFYHPTVNGGRRFVQFTFEIFPPLRNFMSRRERANERTHHQR